MCSLSEFDEKTNHIKISKLLNFEPNSCKGKYSFVYTNLLIVYPLSSKFIAWSIGHICRILQKKHVWLSIEVHFGFFYVFIYKPKYWCTIMYASENSLPH
jgi:hypothetical protein